MSEEMQIDGKTYVSSKRAAIQSTYAQDYIGQLARKSLIEARRIGGLWYVSMESLEAYKKKAEEYKPTPPGRIDSPSDPETLIFFDGKEYLSAPKAAEETGYTQDYVGQLARAGTILSRQVGNRWYVQKESIISHKGEKDALLAAVQSKAVGLTKIEIGISEDTEYLENHSYSGSAPMLVYHAESNDLMPMTAKAEHKSEQEKLGSYSTNSMQAVAIRRISAPPVAISQRKHLPAPSHRQEIAAKSSYMPLLFVAAATIIIVLSVGYASVLKQNSAYASSIIPNAGMRSATASAGEILSWVGDQVEPLVTHELIYQRSDSK